MDIIWVNSSNNIKILSNSHRVNGFTRFHLNNTILKCFLFQKPHFFSINVSTSLIIVYMTQLFSMLLQRVDVVLSLITFLYTLSIVHFYIRMSISIYDKFYSNFITLYGYITSYYSCAHYLWLFLLFRPSCRLTIAMEAIHCSRDFLGDHQFHCFIVSTFFSY